MRGLGYPNAGLPRNRPARSTDSANPNDAQAVLHPLARAVTHIRNGGQRARPAPAACSRVAPVTAGQTNVAAIATAEERRLDAFGGARRGLALAATARVAHVVVYALRDQDQVGEAKVDCEGGYGGHQVGPDGACEVGDVAHEPDDEESERNAICRPGFVVFNQLRYLGDVLLELGVLDRYVTNGMVVCFYE